MPLVVEKTKLMNANGEQIRYDKHLMGSHVGLQE